MQTPGGKRLAAHVGIVSVRFLFSLAPNFVVFIIIIIIILTNPFEQMGT